ncbi:hypothetical protein ACQ4PT_001848 [Festuca glaucescens]
MANFPVDPHRFVPVGFHVLEPWGADERPAHMYVTAPVVPPRCHESWAIAQVVPRPEDEDIDQVLNQVHDHIETHLHWHVVSFAESAIGLGLFRMADSSIRDLLVAQPAHNLGQGRMLTFVRHDEGENFRATVYTRLSWLMMLNLPMDYRTEEFLCDSLAKFGKMCGWIRDDPEPARTMVRCSYGSTRDVPRSIVIRETQRYGGTVVSWSVPVYILSSEPADVLPGDESPEPDNGNPHPQFFVGPIPPHANWVPPVQENWENWHNDFAKDNVAEQEGWDNMQQQQPNMQQQSSITFQYSVASDSSIHLIPSGGPVFEIVVELAPVEIVEIEDITDEVDEDVAVVNHVVVANEMLPVNELAIVPYVDNMLHQLLSQHNTVSEFSGGSSHVDSSDFVMHVSDLATGSAITTDVVSRRLLLEEINGNIALHKEDNSTA